MSDHRKLTSRPGFTLFSLISSSRSIWNIGLSAWIIQDGNYPDFALGDTVEFAVEFYLRPGTSVDVCEIRGLRLTGRRKQLRRCLMPRRESGRESGLGGNGLNRCNWTDHGYPAGLHLLKLIAFPSSVLSPKRYRMFGNPATQ